MTITMETTAQRTTPGAPYPGPRLYALAGGGIASVRRDGSWYLLDTAPEATAPVLRLAGDADDAALEPHICRGID
ncbi:hypothetical protein [Streptomyces sp. NPDC051452]|uniref:hypothetical protein n=1 Tax=Streptomyces sp. NPDC051452 TaxID=3365654 RepID=UPI00378EF447